VNNYTFSQAPKGRQRVAGGVRPRKGRRLDSPKPWRGDIEHHIEPDFDVAPSGLSIKLGSRIRGFTPLATRLGPSGAGRTQRARTLTQQRSAFSLLEVILALAILAGSLAALGEVMRMAGQAARLTESETQAQILTASVMDELASGARQLSAVSQSMLDSTSSPPWVYSVSLEDTGYQQMVAVRVTVAQQLESRLQPAHFELLRWMPNPNYTPPQMDDQSQSSSSSTSGSSSSGSSSGTGSGGQR
jgi:general secretion pathway protein I